MNLTWATQCIMLFFENNVFAITACEDKVQNLPICVTDICCIENEGIC